jgi:hypothetical protein
MGSGRCCALTCVNTHTYTHTCMGKMRVCVQASYKNRTKYTHTHLHTYTPTHIRTYTPIHTHTCESIVSHDTCFALCKNTHTHTYTHTHTHTHTHTYTHTPIHPYMHTHTHTHTPIHTYTHTHTNIPAYTRTHIHTWAAHDICCEGEEANHKYCVQEIPLLACDGSRPLYFSIIPRFRG